MKKIFSYILLFGLLLSTNFMYVNAAHKHSDSCYTVQGAHSHTGDSTNGGGCYTTPTYHSHSGDSASGGGCYTTPTYHSHSGDSASGGECFQTPIYHAHSGTASAGIQQGQPCAYSSHGCYTKAISVPWSSKCGTFIDPDSDGIYNCHNCGSSCPQNLLPTPSGGEYFHIPVGTKTVYTLGCGKGTNTVEQYVQTCTKTTSTIENYDLGCGKDTSTVEGYSLGCGLEESAGTKVLTCNTPESDDKPAPTPSTPTPSTPVQDEVKEPVKTTPTKPAETKPAQTQKNEDTTNDFDFKVECNLVEDGASVKIIPINTDILADNPYSWDNAISWNKSDTSIYAKDGTYYIAIKNKEGKIKAKKLEINLASTNFAVITEYAATLTDVEYKEIIKSEEAPVPVIQETETVVEKEPVKEKSSSAGKVIAAIGIIVGCLAVLGGCGYFIFKILFAGGGSSTAQVMDENGKSIAKIKIKQKKTGNGIAFEANISDKVLMFCDNVTIVPTASMVNKYVGYSLNVRSSQGVVNTEISDSIEVEF